MPPTSLLDMRDAAEEVAVGVQGAVDGISVALSTGTSTSRQLSNLRASLTGYRADIVALRGELDGTDVTAFQLYDDGAVTIQLWRWERALRHSLISLASRVRAAEAVTSRLLAGSAREVYVTRSGDTLQRIAARFLGDWQEWPRIAEANSLAPGAIPSGTRLIIPPRR